ncbi:MAG: RNA methyltransferase [Deltaproteobacteria bacterium]|nr:RNA methyltransferase [Deltaproteobacteria bacterium]MBW2018752.1 RNA methyltransferase [Deltaproteobacteria bacterium]MBW2073481.1 RNA methyltransferase [Deltaproteobacteria bacterium]RLB83014.1 MAG: RNA methyltransferase [Deltaproteobacteria bacterium]
MSLRVNLNNIAIVLHRPGSPENIGAAARAACNMGISQLIVVAPRNCDLTRILKMATHFAADLVEEMEVFDDLETALAPFQYVVGTTARVGRRRPTIPDPRKLAEKLIPISQQNRIALVFGPENWGLTNAELRLCHVVVTIPTAEFASLNLAQAVMILCYEVFLASREDTQSFTSRLATHHELEAMYEQLKETFVNISFINPENSDYWMQRVRRFFSRVDMQARDVRMIRGICRQIEWYGSRKEK